MAGHNKKQDEMAWLLAMPEGTKGQTTSTVRAAELPMTDESVCLIFQQMFQLLASSRHKFGERATHTSVMGTPPLRLHVMNSEPFLETKKENRRTVRG